jgi:transposase InsO family protein
MNQSSASERRTAIHLLRSGRSPVEVAQEMQRSVAWVYKCRKRFFEHNNWDDLNDRSRAPKHCPRKLPETVRQAIRQTRSELEAEAAEPGKLFYIGALAIQARLRQQKLKPLPSLSSIERELRTAGMTRPRKPVRSTSVTYPHLRPTRPQQLLQVDIVTHYLPGGQCVACFNAIDVVSRCPVGDQYASRRSQDAADFLIQAWQTLGIPNFTQVDNEGCFSGGFTHPGVLGKVLRLALFVGTELVFSPVYHPESNGSIERFHQDYNQNVWRKFELSTLESVRLHSPGFFEAYRHSQHCGSLAGHCPAEVHFEQPPFHLPANFRLPKQLPITAGRVHFMRLVNQASKISLLNLDWEVPMAEPDQPVWATLEFAVQGATLRVYDAPPDAMQRRCLAEHPFPLRQPVQPLPEEFQRPVLIETSWFSLAANFFRAVVRHQLPASVSTMS